MNSLRKSLARKSLSRASLSKKSSKARKESALEEEADYASVSTASSRDSRRCSARAIFDSEDLSLEEKLRARARTSIRKSGVWNANDLEREAISWEA